MKPLFLGIALAAATFAQPGAAPAAPASAPAAKPATATATPAWKALKYPPLREVKLPDVTTFTLPNGMKVFLLENHELPVVNGFALIRTGNLFDPKDKVGLADITGTVMRTGGTKAKTGDQINEQLENIAASVESNIGETNGRVGFNCLKENTDEVLAVFRDVLTSPEFRQDKLDLAKTQEKSGISRRNDDAGGIARREFSDILYGKSSPYGWRQEYETVDRITRDDLTAFHKRYFFPKNTMFSIYGDFNGAEMRGKIEKLFAAWTVEQPAVPEFPKVDTTPRPGVYFAAKNDVNQTSFRMGHLAGTLRDKDYPALEVMASVLGGSPFTSRLGAAIRVKRGYAYEIGAAWAASYDHPGIFLIVAGTKSENTVDAIKTIQSEVEKFRSAQPTAEELKSAKDKILNPFVFNFDSPSKTLSRMVTYEYYGYPKDFIFQYRKAVEAVTAADVQRVAKQYLKPEEFSYVLVGNPADIKPPLTALNLPIQPIDLTIPEPKKEVTVSSSASLAQGKALWTKMVAALGGAEKFAALSDYSTAADVEIQAGPAGTMKAQQKTSWILPTTMRQENVLPFGSIVSFYDGQSGWLKSPQGEMPMAGPVLKQVQDQVFQSLINIARLATNPKATANYLGQGTIEISDGTGNSSRLTVDESTGLPLKQSFQSAGMGGPPQTVEIQYQGFSESGGIKTPSKVAVMQGGKPFSVATVTSFTTNTGLKVEDLAKKP